MFGRIAPLLATTATLLAQSSIGLSAGTQEPQRSAEVVVEHADLIISSNSDDPSLEGYLVIWNGTDQSTSITDMRSSAFEEITFVQTVKTKGEARVVVQETLSIPAHSELLMRPGGVFLSIDPGKLALRVGEQVSLEILYANGTSAEVAAMIKPDGAALEDHHHGMPQTGRP
ncbi:MULTISPECIES: copper chaperone PCu(A)C [Aurantimonadaceae]|uniref:Copper chaperone PCu(A)C n=2 Tax=Jiella TaxID=1775688 RepID=A0A6N9T664_9HYPH|nr:MULTISPECIES: copper chaperone PCu(A)C [Aurantimonadaceae]MAU95478.1 copper chaperone PCu(A)C [Fulvimarina sp.]NDW06791.1 copper chaperone PCu(A)C [Jiella pacifica]ORE96972.1 hypothetical protein ATO4_10744 [Aurantimonas sp. 22II-16-19i]WAP71448.1 copper chaperone PCu(A)C [Jiella pelagia]